jgi:hypothetical protein
VVDGKGRQNVLGRRASRVGAAVVKETRDMRAAVMC